ncbi:hypothetical protein AB9P05_06605 [Roseivirga sp. BDSF3-8]|uniref:hypothetical protein n=1 Tax=Roseivirga sp. BDSF3-8 TaxID=3241598 RepID=UPI0035326658
MYRLTSIFFIVALLILPGCFLFGGNDDNPAPAPIPPIEQLPPITTEGKGTFGCLVNGEAFVSYYPNALADYSAWESLIIKSDFRSLDASISIRIEPYNREEIRFISPDGAMQFGMGNAEEACDYREVDNIEGWVEVSDFNPFDEYVSGTFEYTAVNEMCDTVRVTDGRFDLPLVW